MTLDVIGLLTPVIEMMAVTVLFSGLMLWMRERQHERRDRQGQLQFEREKAEERAAQERNDREEAKREAEYQSYLHERAHQAPCFVPRRALDFIFCMSNSPTSPLRSPSIKALRSP